MAGLMKLVSDFLSGWDEEFESIIDPAAPGIGDDDMNDINLREIRIEATCSRKIVLVKPEGFDEVKKLADALDDDKCVLVNVSHLADEDMKRVMDFIDGAAYMIGAKIRAAAPRIYLVTPRNAELNPTELIEALDAAGCSY